MRPFVGRLLPIVSSYKTLGSVSSTFSNAPHNDPQSQLKSCPDLNSMFNSQNTSYMFAQAYTHGRLSTSNGPMIQGASSSASSNYPSQPTAPHPERCLRCHNPDDRHSSSCAIPHTYSQTMDLHWVQSNYTGQTIRVFSSVCCGGAVRIDEMTVAHVNQGALVGGDPNGHCWRGRHTTSETKLLADDPKIKYCADLATAYYAPEGVIRFVQ